MAGSSWKICGCAYIDADDDQQLIKYLPQVSLSAHISIQSSTARTTLKQTFLNPHTTKSLPEIRYQFPLHDSATVVSFTCTTSTHTIRGVVEENSKAERIYSEAAERGKAAAKLAQLPQAPDVFTASIANVAPRGRIEVEIVHVGELGHDAQVDGARLVVPMAVAPRYGDYPGSLLGVSDLSSFQPAEDGGGGGGGGMAITVDAEVAADSRITSIQSPSHPIAVTIGHLSSSSSSTTTSPPSLNRASATLALGTAELSHDFVLHLVSPSLSRPHALLEAHPSLLSTALLLTLVPKFSLPPPSSPPEIVFIIDRSGSMIPHVPSLRAALRLFIKSLPARTRFNLCGFGDRHSFLWDRSRAYGAESVREAMAYVDAVGADYGGTQMYGPVDDTLQRWDGDGEMEVFLLTDGEIWDQARLVGMVGRRVAESKGRVRVFTLGIGDSVSHALIERVARAGNGFAQVVGGSSARSGDMSAKVVRMVKGAMFPHITDYRLELQYPEDSEAGADDDDEAFEVVERPASQEDGDAVVASTPTISLFDESVHLLDADDKRDAAADEQLDYRQQLAETPQPKPPNPLQAPSDIPPLFPFSRTTVYLISSAPTRHPSSVVLRGTSPHGPLSLDIPITILEQSGKTIHQLAAKKAMSELEDGRGWLHSARDGEEGRLVREKHDGVFGELVEREAVRLGKTHQVAGWWCSFVAVEQEKSDDDDGGGDDLALWENLPRRRESQCPPPFEVSPRLSLRTAMAAPRIAYGGVRGAYGTVEMEYEDEDEDCEDEDMGFGLFDDGPSPVNHSQGSQWTPPVAEEEKEEEASGDLLQALIVQQSFEGYWEWEALLALMGWDGGEVVRLWGFGGSDGEDDEKVMATCLVVAWLRREKASESSSWELIVDKAVEWLEGGVVGDRGAEELVERAKEILPANKADHGLFD